MFTFLRQTVTAWLSCAPESPRPAARPRFRPRLEQLETREVPAALAPVALEPAVSFATAEVRSSAPVNSTYLLSTPAGKYEESLSHLWQIVKLTRNACQAPWLSLQFGSNEDAVALANEYKIRRLASAGGIFDDCMKARDLIERAVVKYERGMEVGGEAQEQLVAEGNALIRQAADLAYPAETRWYTLWYKLHGEGWQALARYDIEWVRQTFPTQWPNLRNYTILAPGTGIFTFQPESNKLLYTPGQYNCFAWSVGKTNHYFFPDNYASMHQFYRGQRFTGYRSAAPRLLNPRYYVNVAVYGHLNPETGRMVYTHAARQNPNGTWTSKLGELGLIGHGRVGDLAGGNWGGVVAYYWRRR